MTIESFKNIKVKIRNITENKQAVETIYENGEG